MYDDNDAFTLYNIESQITVWPDHSNLTNLDYIMEKLISRDSQFETNKILNEGSYLLSLQEIQTISSLMNDQSLSDKYGLVLNNQLNPPFFPQTFGRLFKEYSIRHVFFVNYSIFKMNSVLNILKIYLDAKLVKIGL